MGVIKALDRIPANCSLLDLGCGNGNVVTHLAENGFQGTYQGVDFSLGLLNQAEDSEPADFQVSYKELDLTSLRWELILPSTRFDVICCFATLHHIPSQKLQTRLCRNIHQYLKDDGRVYLSVWQFNKSERLKKRILPWKTIGMQDDQVDPGDYLLDWRRGGSGMRYVHLFHPEELHELAKSTGFKAIESFDSDGEGGNLGHYQVWEAL